MTNPVRFTGTILTAGLLAFVGCGGGGGTPSDGAACSTTGGTGTLSVKITGAPATGGSVVVAQPGAAGSTPLPVITADMDLTQPAGSYTITAARVAGPAGGAMTRAAYEPAVDVATACVRGGLTTTVNVTYTVIASSDKLWAGNSGASAMLGFGRDTIAATGAPAAGVAADTTGSDGFTFDAAGNLWVLGATTTDAPLARYRASTLGTSGAKTPDVTIDSPSFGAGIPGAKVVAFDGAGNLWVSVVAANKVVRFTPAQIAVTGSPTAAVEISGINGPQGIAFDAAGNMWVASGGDATLVRVDAGRLGASGTGGDLAITAQSSGAVVGPLPPPMGIAFDGSGNLWAAFDVNIARLTAADLAGTGSKTVTPAIQIVQSVSAIVSGIAFDEQGGLWLAASAGNFARLGPEQLGASGTVTPAIVISSPDVAYAGWFAIYPAPAATPLAHRLP
jgi:sugar lactone lactonase YvrE